MVTINYDTELRRAGARATHGWRRLAFLAQRHMLGAIGLFIMILFVLAALFADLICRYDPLTVDSAHALLRPDARHWMGTDSFGLDVWSRIIHGARISLAVAGSPDMSTTTIARIPGEGREIYAKVGVHY